MVLSNSYAVYLGAIHAYLIIKNSEIAMCCQCRESRAVRTCLTPVFSQQGGKGIANCCSSNMYFFFSKLRLLESCERLGQLGPEGKCHLSQNLVTLIAELNTGA